jgi:hypothetical protein
VIEESIGSSVLQVGEETSNIAGLDRHSAPLLVDVQVLINHSTSSPHLEEQANSEAVGFLEIYLSFSEIHFLLPFATYCIVPCGVI